MSQSNLPIAITVDKAKGEINLALTKMQYSIQALQTEKDNLQVTSDQEGLDASESFLEKGKKILEVVGEAYKKIKAPYKEGADACDAANRDVVASITEILNPIKSKRQYVAAELSRQAKEKKAKEDREAQIRIGVESNVIEYSKRIAAATTVEELIKIQLSISNHKSPSAKNKYGDLHEEAISVYNEKVIPLLNEKKDKLGKLERAQDELDSLGGNDPAEWERIEQLHEKIGDLEGEIQESDTRVQEAALSTSFGQTSTHEVVIPTVKPKRTTPEYKLVDPTTAIKKASDKLILAAIPLDKVRCREVYDSLVEAGKFANTDKIVVDGIEYHQKKVF